MHDVEEEVEFVWTNRLRVILLIMAVAQLSNTVAFSCMAPFYPAEVHSIRSSCAVRVCV